MREDIRDGWRFLASKPFFTLAVVVTLALGIGVNTAMFAIVYAVLLRPLPYAHAQQLVKISDVQGRNFTPFSFEEVGFLSSRGALQSVAAYFSQTFILTSDNGSENVNALRASITLLPMLAVRPFLGPGFSRDADTPGSQREVMLSNDLWRKRYQSDLRVVGKSVRLGEDGFTIVGVLPATFQFVKGSDILVPLRLDATAAPAGLHFLNVVGRMRENATPDQMAAELRPVGNGGAETHGVHVVRLQKEMVSGAKAPVLMLFGATCLILLIASTNVANLLLVRSMARRTELAVRMALGANRSRIARQFFAEAAAVAVAGGAVALFFAWLVLRWAQTSAFALIPRSDEISLGSEVLLFTGAVSLLAALLLNLGPAFQWQIKDLNEPLRSTRQSGSNVRARRWQDALVAAEVALTVTLLCGTGLLIRSFSKVVGESKGFSPERVFIINCNLTSQYDAPQRIQSFYREVRQRLTALPWVESVGTVNSLPLTGAAWGGVKVAGASETGRAEYTANKILADGGYFSTLRIPLLAGRLFGKDDSAQSPQVAVIDQAFARQACGGSACLGRMVQFGWGRKGFSQIVGIVGSVRQDNLEAQPKATVYVPIAQDEELLGGTDLSVVVRTSLEPKSANAEFRAAILAIDKYQPPPTVQAMNELVDSSIMIRKLILTLLSAIAALAVFLSILGIYATMSYAVARRGAEFGLRLALGAQRSDVLMLILRQGFSLACVGLVFGFLGAAVGTRFMSSILYNTSSLDPVTFATVVPLTIVVVLAAGWLPARTAFRVDPASALKCD